MPWDAIAIGTQFANTMVWLCAAWHFLPALRRTLAGQGTREDWHGSWWCAIGIVMVLYMLRWLAAGPSSVRHTPLLWLWACCNVAAVGVGAGVIMTLRVREVDGDRGNIRLALILWFATVLSCVFLAWSVG